MSLIDIDYIIKQKPLSYIFCGALDKKNNISTKDLHAIVLAIIFHFNNAHVNRKIILLKI